jgi:hypothetical protein
LGAPSFAQDAAPPTVTGVTADGTDLPGVTLTSAPSSIVVTFSEDISAATVDTRSVVLIRNAADLAILVAPASVALTSPAEVTVDLAGAVVPDATYELVLLGGTPALGALSFDGSDDFVSVPVSSDLAGGGLSLEAWVFWNGTAHNTVLARWNDITQNYQYVLSIRPDGTIWFQIEPEVGYDIISRTMASIPAQTWTHVAAVADADRRTKTIYIDGIPQELFSDAVWDGTLRSVDMEVNIGRNPAQGRYWHGRIDEVRVWSVARTGSQILQHMQTALDGTQVGLAGYYPMEDGAGQVVTDASAQGNDGVLGVDAGVGGDDPAWSALVAPLTAGIADLAGNSLDGEFVGSFPSGDGSPAGNYVCSFTVAEPPPVVLSSVPADQDGQIPVASAVAVTFSKPMDRASAEGAFRISGEVAGTFSWTDDCMVFTPAEPLQHDRAYAVVVSTEATDSGGRPMADAHVFAFTTAAEDTGGDEAGPCGAGAASPLALLALLALPALGFGQRRRRAAPA